MSIDDRFLNIIHSERAKSAALNYLSRSATVRRGVYSLSESITKEFEEAYENIARLINFDRDEIFFVGSSKEIGNIVEGPFSDMPLNEGIIDISTILHRKTFFDRVYLKGSAIGAFLDVVAMKRSILDSMEPIEYGGDMVRRVSLDSVEYDELPYKFSAGTPDIASILALGAASVDYRVSDRVDEVSEEFKKRLTLDGIPFKYFYLSSLFRIFNGSQKIDLYVPRDHPEDIFNLKVDL